MKLGRLIASIKQELPVTPRHEAWLAENPNPTYSPRAKEFLATEIGKKQRDRTQSFSASSAGMCHRKRLFAYLGLSESQKIAGRTIQIFHNGTYMHLRWQMSGLSAGWLAEPEVPVSKPELRLKGTMDGVLDTGEGLELKSINSNGFSYVMSAGEPKKAHQLQVAYYFLATDLETFSIIYENKDTQDYREFVVHRTPELTMPAGVELSILNTYVEDEELPEIKDLCWKKQGPEYLQCPYREICPLMRDWAHVQETVSAGTKDWTAPGTGNPAPSTNDSSTPGGSRSSGSRLRLTSSSPDA